MECKRVLNAIINKGVKDEEEKDKEDQECRGVDEEEVKEEGVHKNELYIVEDEEDANQGEVKVYLYVELGKGPKPTLVKLVLLLVILGLKKVFSNPS